MKNIIKGLLQTPALLVGILVFLTSITCTVFAIRFNLQKDMLSLETLKYTYYSVLGLVLLPFTGVGIKREFERVFVRGER